MRLDIKVTVYVVHLMHRANQGSLGPPRMEFIGIADSFLAAQQKAYGYVGKWPHERGFTWHGENYATSPDADGSQALVIHKREL